MDELAEEIRNAQSFTPARAQVIAATEANRATSEGNLAAWKTSGAVKTVSVILSVDQDDQAGCECSEMAAGSPYPIDEVEAPPYHPNCYCSLVIDSLAGDEDDEEEE